MITVYVCDFSLTRSHYSKHLVTTLNTQSKRKIRIESEFYKFKPPKCDLLFKQMKTWTCIVCANYIYLFKCFVIFAFVWNILRLIELVSFRIIYMYIKSMLYWYNKWLPPPSLPPPPPDRVNYYCRSELLLSHEFYRPTWYLTAIQINIFQKTSISLGEKLRPL